MPSSKSTTTIKTIGVFLPIAVFYFIWGWSKELGSFGGDNAVYLLTAQYLSPFSTAGDLASIFAQASPYPPLYPLLLAAFGGGESLLSAHLITIACLVIALVVLYHWQRAIGIASIQAYLVCYCFALLPGTYLFALEILSENLYLALSLLALCATAEAEKSGDRRWLLAAAGFVAAATLTRTAGIALVGAFILYLIIHRPANAMRLAVIAVLPAAIYQVLKKAGNPYVASLVGAYNVDSLSALWQQWAIQGQMLGYGWIASFVQYWSLPVILAVGLIGIVCLIGMIYRARLGRLDAIYAICYLLLVLLWPFPGEALRFVFVLLPVLVVQGMWLLNILPNLPGRPVKIWPGLAIGILAIIALPQWAANVQRFMLPLPPELETFRRTPDWYINDYGTALRAIYYDMRVTQGFREAAKYVPEGECIYSIKPSIAAFLSRRPSIAPPIATASSEEFHKKIAGGKCNYFIFIEGTSPSFNTRFYPLERLRGQIKIMEIFAIDQVDQKPVVAILARLNDNYR